MDEQEDHKKTWTEDRSVQNVRKRRLATWETYRNVVRVYRDAKRKAKACSEFYLVRSIKDNKNSFFKCIRNKRKTSKNVNLLLNGVGAQVTEDSEKEELKAFFAFVFA